MQWFQFQHDIDHTAANWFRFKCRDFGVEKDAVLVIGLYELLGNPTT
jgi:hypothetical protein